MLLVLHDSWDSFFCWRCEMIFSMVERPRWMYVTCDRYFNDSLSTQTPRVSTDNTWSCVVVAASLKSAMDLHFRHLMKRNKSRRQVATWRSLSFRSCCVRFKVPSRQKLTATGEVLRVLFPSISRANVPFVHARSDFSRCRLASKRVTHRDKCDREILGLGFAQRLM